MKKKITIALLLAVLLILTACTQSKIVTHNLRREAEDFNVRRRITVLNTRTDTPMMQITGLLSIDTDSDGDLNITIEKAPEGVRVELRALVAGHNVYCRAD